MFRTLSRSEYSMNLSVAASHERLYLCSGVSVGVLYPLPLSLSQQTPLKSCMSNSSENDMKNSFHGCLAQITNFPIARASALVVHRTSLMLRFLKTLHLKKIQTANGSISNQQKKWNTELIIFDNCLKVSYLIRTHGVNYQHDLFP